MNAPKSLASPPYQRNGQDALSAAGRLSYSGVLCHCDV
jgi:hypothetical protein